MTEQNKAQNINKALYQKMKLAQDAYRDWLLKQPPEEILNHAYEYIVREDILMSMESHDLDYLQAKALLRTIDPLSDIFKDFQKINTGYMDTIEDTIESRADKEQQKLLEAMGRER